MILTHTLRLKFGNNQRFPLVMPIKITEIERCDDFRLWVLETEATHPAFKFENPSSMPKPPPSLSLFHGQNPTQIPQNKTQKQKLLFGLFRTSPERSPGFPGQTPWPENDSLAFSIAILDEKIRCQNRPDRCLPRRKSDSGDFAGSSCV